MRLREPLVRPARRLALEARQRLIARRPAGGQLDDRLEHRAQRGRAALEQRRDLVALLRLRHDPPGHVTDGPPAARALGPVQRGVAVGEQLARVDAVGRRGGDTRRRRQRPPAHGQLGQRGARTLGAVLRALGVHARQDQDELLAAEPPDDVGRPHDRPQPLGGGRQHAIALGVAVDVVDDLEVVEVDADHRDRLARRQLLAQALMARAVVEQPGQPVALDLLAQRLPLARRVIGERGHRREALHELDLRVGERRVHAVAVDVQRPEHTVARQQRHAHERLGLVGRARDDVRQRLVADVRHVARLAMLDRPAGDPRPERDRVLEHLVDPVADREHRSQQPSRLVDLIDRQVVEVQQRAQMVGDPPERSLERVGRENPRGRLHQRLERRTTPRLWAHLDRHSQ